MTDYISREALLERIDDIGDCADMVFEPNDKCCRADDCASCKWRETKNAIRKIAANIPAADVREVKRGKWDDKKVAFYFKCSECGCCVRAFAGEVFLDYAQEWNFCPNCGADMRKTK